MDNMILTNGKKSYSALDYYNAGYSHLELPPQLRLWVEFQSHISDKWHRRNGSHKGNKCAICDKYHNDMDKFGGYLKCGSVETKP